MFHLAKMLLHHFDPVVGHHAANVMHGFRVRDAGRHKLGWFHDLRRDAERALYVERPDRQVSAMRRWA